VLIGFMTMIPTLLLLTTSFTRILIVLHLLKQALGTQTAPPGHLLAAMALMLTGFVMAPTFAQVNDVAITPWMDGELDEVQMIEAAAEGLLPRLHELRDLKGDLQMHSTWSDGRHTIEQMALACRALGYEYLAMTDHSGGALWRSASRNRSSRTISISVVSRFRSSRTMSEENVSSEAVTSSYGQTIGASLARSIVIARGPRRTVTS